MPRIHIQELPFGVAGDPLAAQPFPRRVSRDSLVAMPAHQRPFFRYECESDDMPSCLSAALINPCAQKGQRRVWAGDERRVHLLCDDEARADRETGRNGEGEADELISLPCGRDRAFRHRLGSRLGVRGERRRWLGARGGILGRLGSRASKAVESVLLVATYPASSGSAARGCGELGWQRTVLRRRLGWAVGRSSS